jgi:hypothetical protein|tara:strand:- start:103 stop:291 length:189 start_codon:yes stop_codon:yes gene_type:complete
LGAFAQNFLMLTDLFDRHFREPFFEALLSLMQGALSIGRGGRTHGGSEFSLRGQMGCKAKSV